MKRILIALLLSSAALTAFAPTKALKVDLTASQLKWTGYHLAKSYEHWGYVNLKSGSLETDGSKIVSGQFVIDMTTIVDKDLEKANDNAKLVKHLKSDDFFGVEKHPEAKIVIKKTEKKSGNVFNTTADVTIRGITKEINFDTIINSITENEVEATADFRIKRTDFEVMYGWSIENAMLDGEFRIEVKLVAKKSS